MLDDLSGPIDELSNNESVLKGVNATDTSLNQKFQDEPILNLKAAMVQKELSSINLETARYDETSQTKDFSMVKA